MAAPYRLVQLGRAIFGRVSPEEHALVAQLLSPNERALFAHMPRFDQRHCLDVLHTLQHAGFSDPALLRAALLHDCGKVDARGRIIPLIYYGVFVATQRLAPGVYDWAARTGGWLLWPFAAHHGHEARSAALAEAAGSAPETVAILHDYASHASTPATTALHWADDQN